MDSTLSNVWAMGVRLSRSRRKMEVTNEGKWSREGIRATGKGEWR